MKIKGLLGKGSQDDNDEENKTYFMQEIEIDDSEWGKTSNNQTIRQKMVQFFSKPMIAFTMDAMSTILNMATLIWYIIYLDKIRDYTAFTEDGQLN